MPRHNFVCVAHSVISGAEVTDALHPTLYQVGVDRIELWTVIVDFTDCSTTAVRFLCYTVDFKPVVIRRIGNDGFRVTTKFCFALNNMEDSLFEGGCLFAALTPQLLPASWQRSAARQIPRRAA